RGDRGAVRPALRPGAGALLDRGAGRRGGRVGVPRGAVGHGRAAAPAAGRAAGTWVGPRLAPGGRMRALRPPGGLPQARALDPERALRRPAAVPGGRVSDRRQGAEPQFRQGARVGDLGAGPDSATGRSGTVAAPHAPAAIAPGSGCASAWPRPRGARSPPRWWAPDRRARTKS